MSLHHGKVRVGKLEVLVDTRIERGQYHALVRCGGRSKHYEGPTGGAGVAAVATTVARAFCRRMDFERNPTARCPRGTRVQTYLLPKERYGEVAARSFAKRHGLAKVDLGGERAEFARVRAAPPGSFVPGSLRTITLSEAKGVKAVIGCPRPGAAVARPRRAAANPITAMDVVPLTVAATAGTAAGSLISHAVRRRGRATNPSGKLLVSWSVPNQQWFVLWPGVGTPMEKQQILFKGNDSQVKRWLKEHGFTAEDYVRAPDTLSPGASAPGGSGETWSPKRKRNHWLIPLAVGVPAGAVAGFYAGAKAQRIKTDAALLEARGLSRDEAIRAAMRRRNADERFGISVKEAKHVGGVARTDAQKEQLKSILSQLEGFPKTNTMNPRGHPRAACSACRAPIPPPPKGGGAAGYAVTRGGKTLCYSCAAEREMRGMKKHGSADLYMSKDASGRWRVTNWTGDLSFPAWGVRESAHYTFGGRRPRYDGWFAGPDGFVWHCTVRGDMSLARCKRTKERVRGAPPPGGGASGRANPIEGPQRRWRGMKVTPGLRRRFQRESEEALALVKARARSGIMPTFSDVVEADVAEVYRQVREGHRVRREDLFDEGERLRAKKKRSPLEQHKLMVIDAVFKRWRQEQGYGRANPMVPPKFSRASKGARGRLQGQWLDGYHYGWAAANSTIAKLGISHAALGLQQHEASLRREKAAGQPASTSSGYVQGYKDRLAGFVPEGYRTNPTKKDYVATAAILKRMPASCAGPAAREFADYFQEDNVRFDRGRFMAAAGVKGNPGARLRSPILAVAAARLRVMRCSGCGYDVPRAGSGLARHKNPRSGVECRNPLTEAEIQKMAGDVYTAVTHAIHGEPRRNSVGGNPTYEVVAPKVEVREIPRKKNPLESHRPGCLCWFHKKQRGAG